MSSFLAAALDGLDLVGVVLVRVGLLVDVGPRRTDMLLGVDGILVRWVGERHIAVFAFPIAGVDVVPTRDVVAHTPTVGP